MKPTGAELWERWAALGIAVSGKIDSYEDPEHLLALSLEHLEEEERLLGGIATWIWGYGHLLNIRKIKFHSTRARRLFSALLEMSGRKERKLQRMVQRKKAGEPEFVFSTLLPVQKNWARRDPDPHFLKQGFILKRHELVRPKILHEPSEVFRRSRILKNRALNGPTLRTDVLTVLPGIGAVSLRELSRKLHVSAPTLHLVIRDFVQSGLVEWVVRTGPAAKFQWLPRLAA